MSRNAETREERRYRMQRRAVRDGLRDYAYAELREKFVNTVVGGLLGCFLLNAYISWEFTEIPKRHKKFLERKEQKTLLLKRLEKCKKTGNPKRKECTDIWWKWVRLK
ncbi:MAG: hypothetical protein WBB28_24360 [Crinalium sp.]